MAENAEFTEEQREILALLPAERREIANELGISLRAVRGRMDRMDVEFHRRGDGTWCCEGREEVAEEISDYDSVDSPSDVPTELVNALRDGLTYESFEDRFGYSKSSASRLMDDLREMGYQIDFKALDSNGKRMFYIPEDGSNFYQAGNGDGKYTFAVISDTHLGSKATHLSELHDFYNRLEERGIDTVFHCGDISDGWEVHTGHINVIKGEAAGWGRLKEYVVRHYPYRDGIHTYFIEGNHDNKYHRRTGIHLGRLIDAERSDLHYCGDCMARFIFDEENDIDLELLHPSGGKPYTVGYRLQTLYRERAEQNKPTIGIVGHLHGSMYAQTEGVHGFYGGAWKGITTYGKRKGHEAKIGGWILELEIEGGEVRRLRQEWVGYEAEDTTESLTRTDLKRLKNSS